MNAAIAETDLADRPSPGGPVRSQRRALAALVDAAAPTAAVVVAAVRARGVAAVAEPTERATRAQLVALVAALAVMVPLGAGSRPGAEWATVATYRWSPSTLAAEYARFTAGARDEVALAAAAEAGVRRVEVERAAHRRRR